MTADVFDTRGYVLLTSTKQSLLTLAMVHFIANIFSKIRKNIEMTTMEYYRVWGRGFTEKQEAKNLVILFL
jgi:hypothetical protein